MEKRKEIIISEIKYWKSHHLLPAQYCDFLLALYTEGDQPKSNHSLIATLLLSISIMVIPLTILVIYFTQMEVDLQIVILTLLIFVSFASSFFMIKHQMMFYHIPLFSSALLLLIVSVFTAVQFGASSVLVASIIVINCLGWMYVGRRYDISYYIIAGIGGLVIVGGYYFL